MLYLDIAYRASPVMSNAISPSTGRPIHSESPPHIKGRPHPPRAPNFSKSLSSNLNFVIHRVQRRHPSTLRFSQCYPPADPTCPRPHQRIHTVRYAAAQDARTNGKTLGPYLCDHAEYAKCSNTMPTPALTKELPLSMPLFRLLQHVFLRSSAPGHHAAVCHFSPTQHRHC